MKTFLKYTFIALLWCAVASYIVYAVRMAERGRVERKVTRIEIEVVDSTSQGHLVTSARVREWIAASDIRTIGTRVDRVDLTGIEQLIAKNGFVKHVVANTSYSGVLNISISQHNPVVRLLLDGQDAYATDEGYLFTTPRASSLYTPVVTGSYRLPCSDGYNGTVRDYISTKQRGLDERIAELEKQKIPFYKQERKNDRDIRGLRRMRVKRMWWRFESAGDYDLRDAKMREQKIQMRRHYRYAARQIQEQIDQITAQQHAQRQQQKKLEKNYEDFTKLLTFVEFIEDDAFWRSEVVQIVAHTTSSGALELVLVPRSGGHTIIFGRIEQVDRKFDKLLRFYRNGLQSIGWSEYKTIDIRYSDQVVCKK